MKNMLANLGARFSGLQGRKVRDIITAYIMVTPALVLIFTFGIFPVLFAVLPGEHPAREVTIRFGRTVIELACNHVTSVTSAHGRPRAALVRGSTYVLQYWLACVGLGEPW